MVDAKSNDVGPDTARISSVPCNKHENCTNYITRMKSNAERSKLMNSKWSVS